MLKPYKAMTMQSMIDIVTSYLMISSRCLIEWMLYYFRCPSMCSQPSDSLMCWLTGSGWPGGCSTLFCLSPGPFLAIVIIISTAYWRHTLNFACHHKIVHVRWGEEGGCISRKGHEWSRHIWSVGDRFDNTWLDSTQSMIDIDVCDTHSLADIGTGVTV